MFALYFCDMAEDKVGGSVLFICGSLTSFTFLRLKSVGRLFKLDVN